MQKAVSLVHFSSKRRFVTSVTNCGHSPDASARFAFTRRKCQIYFYWMHVSDLPYCYPVLERLQPLLSLVVDSFLYPKQHLLILADTKTF